jgi:predicted nuclease of predicted toxin-antitoxin system
MKLVIDMNLSPRWTAVLRDAGFDARHWSDIGTPNAPDVEILAYAKANGCVVVTHDLDFSAILAATGGGGPSVVQIRAQDLTPESIGPQLVAALRQMRGELEAGALVSLDPNHARLRMLPLPGAGS